MGAFTTESNKIVHAADSAVDPPPNGRARLFAFETFY